MKLYRTQGGLVLEQEDRFHSLGELGLDALLTHDAPLELIETSKDGRAEPPTQPLAPIQGQEVWPRIKRGAETVFEGKTALEQMKRTPAELVGFLTRETSFPRGAFLLTGTGIVPAEGLTLAAGDEISIHIEPIGTFDQPRSLERIFAVRTKAGLAPFWTETRLSSHAVCAAYSLVGLGPCFPSWWARARALPCR